MKDYTKLRRDIFCKFELDWFKRGITLVNNNVSLFYFSQFHNIYYYNEIGSIFCVLTSKIWSKKKFNFTIIVSRNSTLRLSIWENKVCQKILAYYLNDP